MVNVCSDLHKALQSFVKRSNKASSRVYYDSIIHIKTQCILVLSEGFDSVTLERLHQFYMDW